MIRVLHIGLTSNYGGVENFVINLYRNLNSENFQFDFLALANEKMAFEDEIIKMGGNVYHIIETRKSGKRSIIDGISFFKLHSFDIIHMHRNHLGDLDYLWMAKYFSNAKRIIHAHTTNYITPLSKPVRFMESINKFSLDKISTNLIACSNEAGNWMFNNKKFTVIPNSIRLEDFKFDIEAREYYRNKLQLRDNQILLGHIGSFFKVKNQELLIKLMPNLLTYNDNYRLILIGEGLEKTRLENLVANLKLEKYVCFAGKQSDIKGYLSAMDIFLFPSKFEGMPLTLIEAQANGLPIIVSSQVSDEIKVAENVFSLPIDNIDEWVSNIINVDKHRVDNLPVLFENGFDISSTSNKIENYYNEILDAR